MEPWCSDCMGLNRRCSEPSSSTSRSPPIDLSHTSEDWDSSYYHHDCVQIGHCLWLLHDDLFHSLDVADSVTEGVDDFDVLDIRDSIPSNVETFYVVPEALILLLPDGFESLSSRWMFVCALKVLDEHDT
jgi:hypothetical protein